MLHAWLSPHFPPFRPAMAAREICLHLAEILSQILAAVLAPPSDWCLDAIRRSTLSAVCKAWLLTLEHNPSLWTHILLSMSSSSCAVVPAPGCAPYPSDHTGDVNPSFLPQVTHHLRASASSIETLIFRTTTYTEWNAFVGFLDGAVFPSLKNIEVDVSRFHQLYGNVSLPQVLQVPLSVIHLALRDTIIAVVPLYIYTNLETLSLTGTNILGGMGQTPEMSLAAALRRTTRLRRLQISDADIGDHDVLPINLPFLRSLVVVCGGCPPQHPCDSFIARLNTPLLSTLELNLTHSRGAGPFLHANRSKLAIVSSLTIAQSDFRQYCRTEDFPSFFPPMHGLQFLDLSELTMAPIIGTTGVTRTTAFLELLADAIALPLLRTIHIPRSFTCMDVLILAANSRLLQSILAASRRQTPLQIVEQHARCRLHRVPEGGSGIRNVLALDLCLPVVFRWH
ncbi:hypothetical protein C8F01DRAFT_1238255 [Mycena amicta]|nr:hypothetical protein C8F01DRAFT_1238255 [Mycena amicta]